MKIEHFALQVPDPVGMADWYAKHLGFTVARASSPPVNGRFLLEQAGSVMLEIYRNPKLPVPDYPAMDPLAVHLAFLSEDLSADCGRLTQAGARVVEEPFTNPTGDQIAMLRDPWGICLQLIKRGKPMLAAGV